MTTEMQLLRAPDLFVHNDVYLLRRDPGVPDIPLGGAAWILTGQPPKVAHLFTLRHATALALAKLHGYSLWLLAGHTCWQEDNRITRYRNLKLWGSFKASGLQIPAGRDLGEHAMESEKGIRYFGALQLYPEPIESTVKILHDEPISHLVALHPRHGEALAPLLRKGWERPRNAQGPSWEILDAVCSREGIVFLPVGAFDDKEAGTVAFANPSVLERMLDQDRREARPA